MPHSQDIWSFNELSYYKEKEIDEVSKRATERALQMIEGVSNEYIRLKRFYDYIMKEYKKPTDSYSSKIYFDSVVRDAIQFAGD